MDYSIITCVVQLFDKYILITCVVQFCSWLTEQQPKSIFIENVFGKLWEVAKTFGKSPSILMLLVASSIRLTGWYNNISYKKIHKTGLI